MTEPRAGGHHRPKRRRGVVHTRYGPDLVMPRYQFGASDDPCVAEVAIPAMRRDAIVNVFDRRTGKYLRMTRDEAVALYWKEKASWR